MQGLLAGVRSENTVTQVLGAINNPSPRVRHSVTVLDADLQPTSETLPVNWDGDGWVSWDFRDSTPEGSATSAVEVRRSAQLELVGNVDDGLLLSHLFRITTEMQAPDGVWVPFVRGTFTAALPSSDDDGRVIRSILDLQPREHEWSARELDDGITVRSDENVLVHIREDLDAVFGITDTAFPEPEGETTLGEDYYFPAGTSYTAKWRRMLAGIAYDQVTTTAEGLPRTQSLTDLAGMGPEWTYGGTPDGPDARHGRVVVAGSVSVDDPTLPNCVRYEARNGPGLGATLGNGLVIIKNQSTGPASIDQRGREVWRTVQAEAANQTELEAFAQGDFPRLAAGGGLRWTGQVGLNPLHGERDVIRLVRPRLGLSGVWPLTGHREPLRRMSGPDAALTTLTAEARVAVTVEAS